MMDTFDLKWPKTDATFFTDGWRCRIVWRERRGGLGGTIDNNEQCKRRVAASLLNAPYLLNALRARGHGLLAEEIELMQPLDKPPQALDKPPQAQDKLQQARQDRAEVAGGKSQPVDAGASATAAFEARLRNGLAAMNGESDWELTGVKRAKVWQPCGEHDVFAGQQGAQLSIKPRAAKGRSDWVAKIAFASPKQKNQYVAAPALKGLCSYLDEQGFFADEQAVERFLADLAGLDHAEVVAAADAWQAGNRATIH